MPVFIVGAAVTGVAAWLVGDASEKTSNNIVKAALILSGLYLGYQMVNHKIEV